MNSFLQPVTPVRNFILFIKVVSEQGFIQKKAGRKRDM